MRVGHRGSNKVLTEIIDNMFVFSVIFLNKDPNEGWVDNEMYSMKSIAKLGGIIKGAKVTTCFME